jgi:hypothetical protein
MSYFASSEELKEILGGFFEELVKEEKIKTSLIKGGMVIRFCYQQPPLSITIDSRDDGIKFLFDADDPKPDVEMLMKADVAHQFWLGNVNLMMALARRQIVAKGQIPKVLKLLPIIKPAYKLYPEYLKKRNSL